MSDLKNKNKKRTCSFNKWWLSSNEFKEWLAIAEDDGHAKCLVCNSIFSVKSGGISDIKRHSEGALHRKIISGIILELKLLPINRCKALIFFSTVEIN